MINGWELPNGWQWTTLGELAEVKGGITLNKSKEIKDPVSVPYLRVANVQRGHLNLTKIKTVEIPRGRVADFTLQSGDILFNEGGDRDKLGRGWVWNGEIEGCCHQNHVFRARPNPGVVDSKFTSYWGNEFGRSYFEREGKQTTNLASINRTKLRALPVPLPPLPEQRRIVARIEELFSQLDAGAAALHQAKAQLQRYRQSVLAAAVTGQLTQAWREQHHDTEPATELLGRVLKERRATWGGRGKYKEPVLPDNDAGYELPALWTLATIDQLQSRVQYGSSKKTNSDEDGVPVLRMGNILDGALVWGSLKYPPADHSEFPELLLEPGDLLFNRTNSPELVGKTAVYRSQRNPCSFASYLIRVRFLGSVVSEFVAAFINSHFGRKWINSVVSQQVGQANVNGTKLRGVTLPLPPLPEQKRIVAEVDARTTAIDHLEAELDRQITRSNRLRQSTLAAAFSGELLKKSAISHS